MLGRTGTFALAPVLTATAALLVSAVNAQTGPRTTPEEISKLIAKVKRVETAGWARIPWVGSLETGRKISQQEHAPIFLFVLDGNIASGRC